MSDNKWNEESFEYTDTEGVSWSSPKNKFSISVMGFCGCTSDHLVDLAWNMFVALYQASKSEGSWFYDYKEKSEDYCSLQECILAILDKQEIIEHGSSIRGSWLTEKGKKMAEEYISLYERGPL